MNKDEVRRRITELEAQTPRTVDEFDKREAQIRALLERLSP